MPTAPQSYLESLDSTQIAELILALEQRGLVTAPAALPSAPGPIHLAAFNHSHTPSTLSGGEASLSIADVGTSLAVVPSRLVLRFLDVHSPSLPFVETSDKPLSQPSKPTAPRKANRGQVDRISGPARTPYCRKSEFFKDGMLSLRWSLTLTGAVYLPHPSHAAACAHYANAMANDVVEIVLT
ncbi:hypothetical protein EDD18DRAFT_1102170 [Armillaria luteobubalina]|uniref:Uncharacterized protein n=1 Tax=Armillaria luteobubalina TaxID=153913 RepID=A0AA39QEA2_9AGAR|nr:hypothetical protein EDD18DRAFT_1102170 [Armillaria luteobubalina]